MQMGLAVGAIGALVKDASDSVGQEGEDDVVVLIDDSICENPRLE
jgi:hypothetical protein